MNEWLEWGSDTLQTIWNYALASPWYIKLWYGVCWVIGYWAALQTMHPAFADRMQRPKIDETGFQLWLTRLGILDRASAVRVRWEAERSGKDAPQEIHESARKLRLFSIPSDVLRLLTFRDELADPNEIRIPSPWVHFVAVPYTTFILAPGMMVLIPLYVALLLGLVGIVLAFIVLILFGVFCLIWYLLGFEPII